MKKTGENCKKVFKELHKPKWFHQLSCKQMALLQILQSALKDDIDEDYFWRTQATLKEMGMYPLPSKSKLAHVARLNGANSVTFLHGLLMPYWQSDVSGHKQSEYPWNQRLLMSAISYLEMPLLLQTLYDRLPHSSSKRWVTSSRNDVQMTINTSAHNPYLRSVWTTEPCDWRSNRDDELKSRRLEGLIRLRMPCPDLITGPTFFLTHIASEIPVTVSREPAIKSKNRKPIKEDKCAVLEMFQKMAQAHACPTTPPPSCVGFNVEFEVNSDKLLNAVYNVLEDQKECFADISSGLKALLGELKARGMISTTFPEIERHPIIAQLIRHLRGEKMTKRLKSIMLKEAKNLSSCLGMLYRVTELPTKAKPDTTWNYKEQLELVACMQRKIFLEGVWKQSYQCGQNLWRTLGPDLIHSRSFLPTFYSYMPSDHDTIY